MPVNVLGHTPKTLFVRVDSLSQNACNKETREFYLRYVQILNNLMKLMIINGTPPNTPNNILLFSLYYHSNVSEFVSQFKKHCNVS